MSQRSKLNYAQKVCLGRCGKLMQKTGMIWPGARIGVALSGGVDSWTMLKVLLLRQRIVPFFFEIMVLHLNPGFEPENHAPLLEWLKKHQLPAHIEVTDFGLFAHSSKNRKKSPCFLCAWNRRKRLFQLCAEYNLTHLALGHNSDDLVTTFFMNLFQTGRVEGLSPNEKFFSGRLRVIRPMLLVEKKYIRQAANKWNLPVWDNPCPSAQSTKRSEITAMISELTKDNKTIKKNIFNALKKWQLDFYL
ncbi:tRNA lysidine(34) synthetase [Desulfovulcanus ferrireducens]|uniref:tRNA lysidine(34) synthetase n=1 Tax=Desulfovulcanus ferrireducens TaxID=2831190 RepID=UPI003EBA348E